MYKAMMTMLLAGLIGSAGIVGCGDDDTSSTDTDTDTDSDTDTDVTYGVCKLSCTAPADCVPTDPNETHDADNFDCTNDVCVWKGCLNTAECEAVYPAITGIACDTNVDPPECTDAYTADHVCVK